jgi:hypothetical protein
MKVVEVKDVQSKPNPHGVDARNISDTESAQVVHITLKPGESLKKHITPWMWSSMCLKAMALWRSMRKEMRSDRTR